MKIKLALVVVALAAPAAVQAQSMGFVPPPAEEASAFLFQQEVGEVFKAEHALLRFKKFNFWGFDRSTWMRMLARASSSYMTSSSWAGRNCVTTARNQGTCGSCWAFAATAALESAWCMELDEVVDAAEQTVLECQTAVGQCTGGWENVAYDVMRAQGLDDEVNRPYSATAFSSCNGPRGMETFFGIDGSVYLTPQQATGLPSIDDIKAAIVDSGAVTTSVVVTTPFVTYNANNGPIINTPATMQNPIGLHEVVLVGWDDERGAWRFKNSWGGQWSNDAGFGWIVYNDLSLGGNNVSHVFPVHKWNANDRARIFAAIATRALVLPRLWGDNPYVQFPKSLGFPTTKMRMLDGFRWAIANGLGTRLPAEVHERLR